MNEKLRALGKNPVAVGTAVISGLLLMAWVVSLRLGSTDMPMNESPDMFGAFGTPGDLVNMADKGESAGTSSQLPFLAPAMPPFSGIASWLNSAPLTPQSLKGKVVLVDFWTYSCINCIRTFPYLTAWQKQYGGDGFTIIGVHTPEFAFEKDESNVRKAMAKYGITYPVALDNDYATWNNYNNHYWPAHYLFDAQGRLRYTHFGEGEYDQTENNIRALMAEAGADAAMPMADVTDDSTVDFTRIATPETYVGYARMDSFGSPEKVLHDAAQTYTTADEPKRDELYLAGTWRIEEERAVLVNAPGAITFRYNASAAHLVMGSGADGAPVLAEVTLDGGPVPAELRGKDVFEKDGKTWVEVAEQRLYNLIDGHGDYRTRTLRIEFQGTGVEAYAFTFG